MVGLSPEEREFVSEVLADDLAALGAATLGALKAYGFSGLSGAAHDAIQAASVEGHTLLSLGRAAARLGLLPEPPRG